MLTGSQDFDLHIPVGSLMGIFRNNITDLVKFKPYLKANPDFIADFSERLNSFKDKKLVGLCWRSGKLSANRNLSYLSIDDLSEVLELQECIFVNLQYGECEDELNRIESKIGIKILRWDDVDLKNNQEQLAALISCLNVVVTAGTAVLGLSMALGSKTIMFGPRGWDFLGQSNYPWSPYVESLSPEESSDLSSVVPQIVKILQE
jgi:ADP-heptose:LPS heptosyltransferase